MTLLAPKYQIWCRLLRMILWDVVCKVRVARIAARPAGQTSSLHDKCTGFLYMQYTTHRTYSFMPHLKDEAFIVKCLAYGHKSGYQTHTLLIWNTSAWVQCPWPLAHDMPLFVIDSCIHWHGKYFHKVSNYLPLGSLITKFEDPSGIKM